jgi:amino acid adenylation domain-containing protein
MLVALLATLKAGGTYLPMNFEHPPARLAHMLAESGARVVISQQKLADRLQAFAGAIVPVDSDAAAIAERTSTNPNHATAPDELVYIMYTSGSTGTPKGVAVTHRNLSTYLASIRERLLVDDNSAPEGLRFGVVSAISTDLGNTSLFTPLVSGGCIHLISAEASMDGDAFATELGDATLDVIKITPSHLRALLTADCAAVLPRRWLVVGGEALTWDLVDVIARRAPDCRILNHYGPTETTVGCCTYLVDRDRRADSQTVPIGSPLAGARAYVVDRHLEPVPAGVPGELCIGGAGVAAGYVGQDSDGAARFLEDPFAPGRGARMYRTGDRARRLRDGAIEFLGRVDDQVKIRGFRIEPGEIEAALAAHPAIRQAAVVAEDDEKGGMRLVAYIVAGQVPPVEELEAFLAQTLPDYMIPSAFATLEALLFTPSGKVDRRALSGLAEVQTRQAAAYVAPRDETEARIADIWRELLGVDRIGVEDDFFALGGHSLLATQAIMRIRREYGDIPLRALLAAPTVASLAEVVRAASNRGL